MFSHIVRSVPRSIRRWPDLPPTLLGRHPYSTLTLTAATTLHRLHNLRQPLTSSIRYHPRFSLGILPPFHSNLVKEFKEFHSTPPNNGFPALIPILASFLKASTGFELARVASRVALTFIPFLWFNNVRTQKMLKYAALHGFPISEEKQVRHMMKIRRRTLMLQFLLLVPFVLFWATITASLERTPLTGRWRMILLSPEEEDEIAEKLAGAGWYNSVGEILKEHGSPRAIPTTDWRYRWVSDTLRRLESSLPVLSREPELCPNWMEGGEDSKPLPPPAKYPLRARPRASEYLHWFCKKMSTTEGDVLPPVGSIPGVPYSLLVVDKPECSNAFSFGFGPDGGSGIVVYTGFLDEILSRHQPELQIHEPPPPKSFWNSFFGGIFSSASPAPSRPTPTSEQTAELAILLAHEMAHLILSHHLESLSSVNVIVPGTLSIASDIIRVVIFPFTMLFGPFVNDAVAQLGKVGSGELLKISEYCSSTNQEIEADIVSARLLAHAGFDARDAVKFWEQRSGDEAECGRPGEAKPSTSGVAMRIMGDSNTHPVNEIRVSSLRDELARWEAERQKALAAAAAAAKSSSSSS